MRVARGIVAVVVLAVTTLGLGACDVRRDRPVLLVHGWSISGGTDCDGTFGDTVDALAADGFAGPFVTLGFYSGDQNCTASLRDWGGFGNSSSWKEIAKALSWYVHDTYTVADIPVDLVGYSMGGNIIRGAVQGSASGEPGFSPPILVEDAVTLGAPHDGAAWYSHLCLWGQCSTLKPGASAIDWLDEDPDPQGAAGTEWTVMGSLGDAVVPLDSALEMDVPPERMVAWPSVPHTGGDDYNGDPEVIARTLVALAERGS